MRLGPMGRAGALVASLGLWLTGCATPYGPLTFQGGYRELQVSEDVFVVSFHWNPFTPPERIEDFLLLRAAEVALDRGAPYFLILEEEQQVFQRDVFHGTRVVRPLARLPARRTSVQPLPDDRMLDDARRADLRIQLLQTRPPSDTPVMDAAKLRAELQAKYGLGP